MQNIFGEEIRTEPEFYLERIKKVGTSPAPENGFPNFDGYEVEAFRMRETVITALTHDVIDVEAAPEFRTKTGVRNPRVSYTYEAWKPAEDDETDVKPVAKKVSFRIAGRDIALWLCVGQLGVIVWWLLGSAMHPQREADVAYVPPTNQQTFGASNGGQQPAWFGLPIASAPSAPVGPNYKQSGSTAAAKKNRGGRHGLVPPPPPEMANGKMMVPPPPIAYSLAPGAAAAAVLPPQQPIQQPIEMKVDDVLVAPVVAEQLAPASSNPFPDWLQFGPAPAASAAISDSTQPTHRTIVAGNRQRIITDR